MLGACASAAKERADAPSSFVVERIRPELDAIVPPDFRWEVLGDGFTWIEGPVWRPSTQDLLFSDIPNNRIHRYDPSTGRFTVFLEPSGYTGTAPFRGREPGSNGLALDGQGRLLICQHGDRRLVRRDGMGAVTVVADRVDGRRLNSPNDVVVSRTGDVLFTDPPFGLPMAFDDPAKELPVQGVYRVPATGGPPERLTDRLRAPNGIALSPDESTLYLTDVDPAAPGWWRFRYRPDAPPADGVRFQDAAPFMDQRPGDPDGLEVDDEGRLYGAGPGGVYIFDARGRHLGTLLTADKTSNLAWGGDGRDLYVTANHRLLRGRLVTGRTGRASYGSK
jgi:gluconolactonase